MNQNPFNLDAKRDLESPLIPKLNLMKTMLENVRTEDLQQVEIPQSLEMLENFVNMLTKKLEPILQSKITSNRKSHVEDVQQKHDQDVKLVRKLKPLNLKVQPTLKRDQDKLKTIQCISKYLILILEYPTKYCPK